MDGQGQQRQNHQRCSQCHAVAGSPQQHGGQPHPAQVRQGPQGPGRHLQAFLDVPHPGFQQARAQDHRQQRPGAGPHAQGHESGGHGPAVRGVRQMRAQGGEPRRQAAARAGHVQGREGGHGGQQRQPEQRRRARWQRQDDSGGQQRTGKGPRELPEPPQRQQHARRAAGQGHGAAHPRAGGHVAAQGRRDHGPAQQAGARADQQRAPQRTPRHRERFGVTHARHRHGPAPAESGGQHEGRLGLRAQCPGDQQAGQPRQQVHRPTQQHLPGKGRGGGCRQAVQRAPGALLPVQHLGGVEQAVCAVAVPQHLVAQPVGFQVGGQFLGVHGVRAVGGQLQVHLTQPLRQFAGQMQPGAGRADPRPRVQGSGRGAPGRAML
ncbi:hypothetical protein ACFP9V_11875 [Deinococcus radiopugnans]|uniref:hypothetical protein n=1 Tax=Deinococcus radiopugnans TaxID=57497 RepID=UPI0036072EC4